MAVKVPITTYRNNAAATFWGRLGTFLSFLTPLVIFCMIMVPLSFPNHGKMHTILWVLWVILSIFVGVVYFFLTFTLCILMERKALQGQGDLPCRSDTSRDLPPNPRPVGTPPTLDPGPVGTPPTLDPGPVGTPPTPPQTLHPSLRKLEGQEPEGDWEETTLI